MAHFGFVEAGTIGLLQGVTELFPVSSLGHSVLLPAVIGGRWSRDLSVSASESPYLAFIVAVHVATAIALIIFYRRDWVRIVGGLLTSMRDRKIDTPDQRLAWLLILATIPVGITGLALEHVFRTTLGRPVPAALFLTVNGLVLLAGERQRRRARSPHQTQDDTAAPVPGPRPAPRRSVEIAGPATPGPQPGYLNPAGGTDPMGAAATAGGTPSAPQAQESVGGLAGQGGQRPTPGGITDDARDPDRAADHRLAGLSVREVLIVGCAQIAALAPGISRSGSTMVAGLTRGLSHDDAARFAFLLATPVILAAGLLKLPDLFGPLGDGVRGQTLVGAVLAGCAAYVSLRFLSRWFETRSLTPFAVYCLAAGLFCLVRFGIF